MHSKKEKIKAKQILWVKAKDILDLVRGACSFDTYSKDLISIKKGEKTILCLCGEELDDTTITYYTEWEPQGEVAIYSATPEGESLQFSNEGRLEQLSIHYINILPIEIFPFEESKDPDSKNVIQVKVRKWENLVKSILKKSVEKEEIESAYVFELKGKNFIGAFDIIEELSNSKKIFYYAELNAYETSSFIRYNYSADKIEFTENFGEHSYLYVKLINLAQPFPFFKG
ncbi:MAG: hypothetical protein ACP5P2_01990 [Candidatus Micrarchaeia archaeon]